MIIKNMRHPLDILCDRIISSIHKIVNLSVKVFLSGRRVARVPVLSLPKEGTAPSQHFPPSQTHSKSIEKIYRFEGGIKGVSVYYQVEANNTLKILLAKYFYFLL
jgi:uncharacterized protein (DUF427 family)